jgi:hypothetical protein
MVVKGIFIAAVVVAAKLGNASVNGKIYCVIPDVMQLSSTLISFYLMTSFLLLGSVVQIGLFS